MTEYIDRNKIYYREIVDYCDEQNMCNVYCDVADKVKIDRLPSADVVEREKIDKAIKEMKLEYLKYATYENKYLAYYWMEKAIKILKRNIGGNEDDKNN